MNTYVSTFASVLRTIHEAHVEHEVEGVDFSSAIWDPTELGGRLARSVYNTLDELGDTYFPLPTGVSMDYDEFKTRVSMGAQNMVLSSVVLNLMSQQKISGSEGQLLHDIGTAAVTEGVKDLCGADNITGQLDMSSFMLNVTSIPIVDNCLRATMNYSVSVQDNVDWSMVSMLIYGSFFCAFSKDSSLLDYNTAFISLLSEVKDSPDVLTTDMISKVVYLCRDNNMLRAKNMSDNDSVLRMYLGWKGTFDCDLEKQYDKMSKREKLITLGHLLQNDTVKDINRKMAVANIMCSRYLDNIKSSCRLAIHLASVNIAHQLMSELSTDEEKKVMHQKTDTRITSLQAEISSKNKEVAHLTHELSKANDKISQLEKALLDDGSRESFEKRIEVLKSKVTKRDNYIASLEKIKTDYTNLLNTNIELKLKMKEYEELFNAKDTEEVSDDFTEEDLAILHSIKVHLTVPDLKAYKDKSVIYDLLPNAKTTFVPEDHKGTITIPTGCDFYVFCTAMAGHSEWEYWKNVVKGCKAIGVLCPSTSVQAMCKAIIKKYKATYTIE